MLLFQFSSYTTVVEAERSQLVRVCVSEEEECVCQQVTVCVCVFTYLCGHPVPTSLRHFSDSNFSFRVTVKLSLGLGAGESIMSSRCPHRDMKT